jgi:hypothetical protein
MGQEAQVGEDFTLQNNFTHIAGSHTLKIGYELMRTRYNAVLAALPGGTYNFSGTEMPFTANTGNTFASFLLGTVGSAQFSQNFASWLPRMQASVSKSWAIKEHVRLIARLDMMNLPRKQPSCNQPNSTFNVNSRTPSGPCPARVGTLPTSGPASRIWRSIFEYSSKRRPIP